MRSNCVMVLRPLAAVVLLSIAAPAGAVVPRSTPRLAADSLTALPAASVARPLRTFADLRFGAGASAAWRAFAATGRWEAAWDAATGVPSRIWGSGLPAFGAMASPGAAEAIARAVLAANLALLAPGAQLADFVLVSNQTDGAIRTIGFVQQVGGRRVVGGQLSFEFKNDRLFVLGSQALPDVAVTEPRVRLARAEVLARATTALRTQLALPAAQVSALGDEVILPLVGADAVLGYRLVSPLEIDGGADGRYVAYVDATGAPIAVVQRNRYAAGTVDYLGLDRYKGHPRVPMAAPRAFVTVAGAPKTTLSDGTVAWSPDAPEPLVTTVAGDLVTIVNQGMGPLATTTLTIVPSSTLVWDASADVETDAQVNAYLDTNLVKEFVRAHIDAHMPTLDQQITINTNIAMDCNAFFDGKAINLFHATATCENTGLIQDVLFHEFGHDLHESEIIMGVGSFDGAMSEGAGDTLAVNITNDSGMGRGFFFNDVPLRELDPPNMEWTWPRDIAEIHHTGMIYGGALWDLRKALMARYGDGPGRDLLLKLYLGTLRRAVDIPTSLIEALAEDDDDGDLSNGTPNECAIRDAYGRHGLRTATGAVEAPGFLDANARSTLVRIDLAGLSTRCGGDTIATTVLRWGSSSGQIDTGQATAVQASNTSAYAQLPLAFDDDVLYQANITFVDGSVFTLPDNRADPFYQTYQGHTVALYCTNMDTDPFSEGWTTGTGDGSASPWAWGVPTSGATDPHAAFTGDHVLALGLDKEYAPMQYSWAKTPPIDVKNYSDVRLQYRRWLGVEDSHFDQARILANDTQAWVNSTENKGDSSARSHIDREWRFHDVALSGFFTGHTLQVTFDLKSDPGLQLAGWTIDDLCVVANTNSICGDGIVSRSEECDHGAANADAPDACRTSCRAATCGDGIVDSNEQCDEGPTGGNECTKDCQNIVLPTLGGCCSSSRAPAGSLLLGASVLLVLRRRRR